MTNRLTIAVALVAGISGGLLTRYITPTPVFAQAPPAPVAEFRAQSFVLTDKRGSTMATFTAERTGDGPQVVLQDNNGKTIWKAGATALVRPLSLR